MSNIRQEMKKGLFWTALDKYSGQIIGIVISMILARLLTPYDYGVVATASVLLGFLSIFTSAGIGPAIIQRNDLSQDDLNNIFTFSIILGLVIGSVSFGSSWVIADFYGTPLLTPVIQILSVGLFFGTINMVPAALMSKNKRFKEMATRSLAFQVLFGVIGIISAFLGAGVYALVCPQIFASLCTFLYNNHFYPVRISSRFHVEPIKRIISFSSFVFLSEFTNYFARNLDKLIIGKTISANALGYYEKSYRLMQMPLNNVSSVIYPVLQPIMTSLQNDMKEMSTKYAKIVSIIASVGFPIAVILYFTGQEIMVVMFGEVWLPAVPTFKILALSIPTMLICNPNGAIFLSCNASKQMFYVTIINTCLTVIGFIVAAVFGGTIEAIAWGWTGSGILATFNSYFQLYVLVMHQSLIPVLKSLIKPVINACILIVVYMLYDILMPSSWFMIAHLILKCVLGLMIVLSFLRCTNQFDVIAFAKSRIK
ncbi:lipopolysaccharide biosynthesis protein [Bacteroides faecium]|uniref:Lipopolysaccharide biosynthesis protein n=1 Tax=Bacteroides faecium TaxID=2715212 RepID=A0A6H0KSG3_9BACE|nr:lipopolysaccharide biosynthesis protein [Bacteroides faecium]QIU96292.1 lipopolysaccharide biosynthesis protein [Bacteroides faecium]